VQAIKTVAARLGNTPSVCRKCYVHPAVLDCYLGGSIKAVKKRVERAEDLSGALQQEETALMQLLRQSATGNGTRTKNMK
jgi:DNA topoisomerase-1